MEEKKPYINNMREIRLSKKYTQEEVAEKMGIKKSFYSMIERNCREPRINLVLKFSKAMNVKVDKVFRL